MARILVIEDSLHIRKLVRDILGIDGHTIIEAEDGSQGLQLAAAESPDCILLDLIMPGISGLNVLKDLHEGGSKIPVIIVTAHLQDSVHNQCLALGAAAFINKPFLKDELRHTVKKVLGSK
jgi:CheY-like chemotaxis protein